ncbi:MAG: hypothetical protein ABIH92_05605 [Nanoarchaeota archaeon]
MDFKKAVQIFVGGIIIIGVLMAVLGFNGEQIDLVIQWFIPLGLNFIFSSLVGTIIEAYGGEGLKKISLTIPIWRFSFSISLFVILTAIIKFWWFG